MHLSRRDFLKLTGAVGIASTIPIATIEKALAGNADPRVIWLQGQSCSGCSVSLMNLINCTTTVFEGTPNQADVTVPSVQELLTDFVNLEYHSTLIAAAGEVALLGATGPHPSVGEIAAFSNEWLTTGGGQQFDLGGPEGDKDGTVNMIDFALLCKQGYILVVEGSIPINTAANPHNEDFCHVGHNLTMQQAFAQLAPNADQIIAIGACATFGGIPGAVPLAVGAENPTGALGTMDALTELNITSANPVINIPGCPSHPAWFVSTVVRALVGETIALDGLNRPVSIYGTKIHGRCQQKANHDSSVFAPELGLDGCQLYRGCRGKQTYANCPSLKWNNGVSWCVQTRSPCHGCTEPSFPGTEPFVNF